MNSGPDLASKELLPVQDLMSESEDSSSVLNKEVPSSVIKPSVFQSGRK